MKRWAYQQKYISLHKISCTSAISSKLDCVRFALSLHKISCTSAISSKLDCVRFALSLHKISCTSAISSKLDCVRFALSLQTLSETIVNAFSHSQFGTLSVINRYSFLDNYRYVKTLYVAMYFALLCLFVCAIWRIQ